LEAATMEQQPGQNMQKTFLNEARIRELIMETLIELDLIQKPELKKALIDV
jgi:hypothetical protein